MLSSTNNVDPLALVCNCNRRCPGFLKRGRETTFKLNVTVISNEDGVSDTIYRHLTLKRRACEWRPVALCSANIQFLRRNRVGENLLFTTLSLSVTMFGSRPRLNTGGSCNENYPPGFPKTRLRNKTGHNVNLKTLTRFGDEAEFKRPRQEVLPIRA